MTDWLAPRGFSALAPLVLLLCACAGGCGGRAEAALPLALFPTTPTRPERIQRRIASRSRPSRSVDRLLERRVPSSFNRNDWRLSLYVRVVRFTGVSAERMDGLLARINESGGPPPGVAATGLQVLFDEAEGTAVVLQHFATAEDMSEAAKVMSAMDPSETPGTRVSVDACELKLEVAP